MKKLLTFMACAALAGSVLAATPKATLRIADSLPAGHFFAEQGLKFWMAEVKRLTNQAIALKHFPAEQLGKEENMLQLVMTGAADIAYVVPAFVPDKLPMMTVSELPGLARSSCHGTTAFLKLVRGGLLETEELDPVGVVVLFAALLEPYQIYATHPIASLEALKGLRLRTAGDAQAEVIKALGAVPVNLAAPEIAKALAAGKIDGASFPPASIMTYDLARLLKGGTQGASFGTVLTSYVMSRKIFDRLPENVRRAMLRAGDGAARNVCEYLDSTMAKDQARIDAAGVKLINLSKSDAAFLAEISGVVQQKWADRMNRRGKPGSAVLKAYIEALE